MKTLVLNRCMLSGGNTRRVSNSKASYLIVPVTMMVEGVHSGTKGPLLYEAVEGRASVESWNNVTICNGHPPEGVSANDAVWKSTHELGTIQNARWLDGVGLVADAQLDVALCTKNAPELLARIENKETVEVSTGLDASIVAQSGIYNASQPYVGIVRGWEPDHLAILLDSRGACSAAAGCGLDTTAAVQNQAKDDCTCHRKTRENSLFLILNEMSRDAEEREIRRWVDQQYPATQTTYSWLEDVFNTYFVVATSTPVGTVMSRIDYVFSPNLTPTVGPQVKRTVVYEEVPVSTNTIQNSATTAPAPQTAPAQTAPAAGTAQAVSTPETFEAFLTSVQNQAPPQFASQFAEIVTHHKQGREALVTAIQNHSVGKNFSKEWLDSQPLPVLQGMADMASQPVTAPADGVIQNQGATTAPAAKPSTTAPIYTRPASANGPGGQTTVHNKAQMLIPDDDAPQS